MENIVLNELKLMTINHQKTSLDHVNRKEMLKVSVDVINPNQAVCVIPATSEILLSYPQNNQQQHSRQNFQQQKRNKETPLIKRDSRDVYITNKISHRVQISFSGSHDAAATKKKLTTNTDATKVEKTMSSVFVDFIVYDSVCQECEFLSAECNMKKV